MKEVAQLDRTEQLELLVQMAEFLKQSGQSEPTSSSLLHLAGLGKEIWEEKAADDYLNQLREEW